MKKKKLKKKKQLAFVLPQIDCTKHEDFFAFLSENSTDVAKALAYFKSPTQEIDEVFVLRALISCINLLSNSSEVTELFSLLLEQDVDWDNVFNPELFCALKEKDPQLKDLLFCTSILQVAISKRQIPFAVTLINKGASINDQVVGEGMYNNTLELAVFAPYEDEEGEEHGIEIIKTLVKRSMELRSAGLTDKAFTSDNIQSGLETAIQVGYGEYLKLLLQDSKVLNSIELIQVLSRQICNFFSGIYSFIVGTAGSSEDVINHILAEETQSNIRNIYKNILTACMQMPDFKTEGSEVTLSECLYTLEKELNDYIAELSIIRKDQPLKKLNFLLDFENSDEEEECTGLLKLIIENEKLRDSLLTFFTEFSHDTKKHIKDIEKHLDSLMGLSSDDDQSPSQTKKTKKKKKKKGKKAAPSSSPCAPAPEPEETTDEEEEVIEPKQQEAKVQPKQIKPTPTPVNRTTPTQGAESRQRKLRHQHEEKAQKPISYKTEKAYEPPQSSGYLSLPKTSSLSSCRGRSGVSTCVTSSTPVAPRVVHATQQVSLPVAPPVNDETQFPSLPQRNRSTVAAIMDGLSTTRTEAPRTESPASSDSAATTPRSSLGSVIFSPPQLSPPLSSSSAPSAPTATLALVDMRQQALTAAPPGLYVPVVAEVTGGTCVTLTEMTERTTTLFFSHGNMPRVLYKAEVRMGPPTLLEVCHGDLVECKPATEVRSSQGKCLVDTGMAVYIPDASNSTNPNPMR